MDNVMQCRVISVNETATKCQTIGNSFPVDGNLKGKLCARSQALVEAAAARLAASNAQSEDIHCPDDFVVFRVSRTGGGA
jgi:hypothetical protein